MKNLLGLSMIYTKQVTENKFLVNITKVVNRIVK